MVGVHLFVILFMLTTTLRVCSTQNPDDHLMILRLIIDGQHKILNRTEEHDRKIESMVKELQSKMTTIEEQREAANTKLYDVMRELQEFKNMIMTDECEDQSHGCSIFATCTNTLTHYKCSCLPGYSGDGFICQDVDECVVDVNKCGYGATCINNPGSYSCQCLDGFQEVGNICQDINECETGLHGCHSHATCNNTIGNYTCKCNQQYIGDGHHCEGPSCQSPFDLLPDVGCIKLVTSSLSWAEALSNCEDMGGHLYEGGTPFQNKILIRHFRNILYRELWIGARNGLWVTSGKPVPHDIWKDDADNTNKICGCLWSSTPSVINAEMCFYALWSVCQAF